MWASVDVIRLGGVRGHYGRTGDGPRGAHSSASAAARRTQLLRARGGSIGSAEHRDNTGSTLDAAVPRTGTAVLWNRVT